MYVPARFGFLPVDRKQRMAKPLLPDWARPEGNPMGRSRALWLFQKSKG
ncbi:hypothetical protein SJ05684_c32810 [Sinorhizobium sojae CCBAU 05684]|uniref:Uncharacterized protein n=1 Tax=Sinorhizobium sojae CCBAU 05684 TaxID=716928 RepID=A0A249PFI2_9HYPH|nr:hypothetical protein SJ05684_c32810 [Sinorhizobium sojae CCBAU 05684]